MIRKLIKIIAIIVCVLFVGTWLFSDDEDIDSNAGTGVIKQDDTDSLDEYAKTDDEVEEVNGNTNIDISNYFDTTAVREKQVVLKGDGTDKVTILVYVNGSNLETDDQEASEDISEMISAGTSENVTTVIQTMGTKKWSKRYGIASDHSQRYIIADGGLKLVDDSLPQLDCTKASTLSDFIKWGVSNYPADRYILQFWNHGAGPVYGFGYDEWQDEEDSMPLDQMKKALSDAGIFFDFIGMDCCIMSCLETGLALYDYCDYMILSEEFESGLGWSYKGWMKALNENSSIDTVSLAKIAIDDNVDANEDNPEEGDSACMSLIDEAMMKILYTAWIDFAYKNEDSLLGENYSQQIKRSKRARPMKSSWGFGDEGFFSNFDSDAQLSDYYITDIMAVAQNIESNESAALSAALSNTIIYNRTTSDNSYMTGLAVTLPYGDRDFYTALESVFTGCGIDSDYVSWLKKFVTAEGSSSFYNYESDWDDWDGWEDYEDDYDWGDWSYYDDEEYWDDDECWGWDDDSYWEDEEYWYDDRYWYDDGYCEDDYCDNDYYYDDYYDDDGYSYDDARYWWW